MNKKTITLVMMLLLAVVGANADVIPSSYYSEPAAGTYYIYNVTKGKFLRTVGVSENNYSLLDAPVAVTLTAKGETVCKGGGDYILSGNTNNYIKIGQYNGQWLWPNAASGNADILAWTFNSNGTKTYTMSITLSEAFSQNNSTLAVGTHYMKDVTNLGSEAEAGTYAFITPANYLQYYNDLKANAIPSTYYSTLPTRTGDEVTAYLYDAVNKKFLNTTVNGTKATDAPAATVTVTKLASGYSISGVSGKYLKYGSASGQYLWSDNADPYQFNFEKQEGDASNTFMIYDTSSRYIYGTPSSSYGANLLSYNLLFSQWTLITDANYKSYLDTYIVPTELRSDVPAVAGSYYVYDIVNKKFLKTTTWPPSMNDEGELITFTPSERNSESGFLISGRTNQANPEYIKIGWVNKEAQCVWSNASTTNTLWKIVPAAGESSRKAYYIYTDNYEEKDSKYSGATQYLISGNASTTEPIMSQWILISASDYESWKNNVTLDDTEDFTPTTDVFAVNVTVNRSMTANVWNTLVVPFDMAIPSGWTVKEPTTFADGTLTFGDASSIAAGKPYIVKPTEAVTSFSATGVTLKKDLQNTSVSEGALTMIGTYANISNLNSEHSGCYIIGIKNGESNLYKVNSAVSLKPFRAYFSVADPSLARINLNFDDEATSIGTIANSQELKANSQYYNLQGQRVENPKRGLYIVNGKKVMVK